MPKKKHVYNKSTGRDYKYDSAYEKKHLQDREERNKARAEMLDHLTKKYGSQRAHAMLNGKDVDHKHPLGKGGSNAPSNRRLLSIKKNRGRDKSHKKHKKGVY